MSLKNLKICAQNQQGYQNLYLNDSLHLQYYGFVNIDNLSYCVDSQTQKTQVFKDQNICKQQQSEQQQKQNKFVDQLKTKGINTIFLNNNQIVKIQNLHFLKNSLKTLNLSYNRIQRFQGLKQLHQLCILDLSHNRLSFIDEEEIQGLYSLTRLNLNSNIFVNQCGIKAIRLLAKNLQILQIANNQLFDPQTVNLLTQIFVFMQKIKVLIFKNTPFARKTLNYRKQTIYHIPSLKFLDDRPVNDDQKLLINAWKKGGINQQRQVRQLIIQKKQQKNKKIIIDIQQRNKIIQQKVQKIFQMKANKQKNELKRLNDLTKLSDFDLKDYDEQNIINLQIQQLQRYLYLLKQQCKGLDLNKQLGLCQNIMPRMFIEKRTNQCIYIYNVNQQQLEAIKIKYYVDQNLPILSKNYEKPDENYWLVDYNQILQKIYNICKGNWQLVEVSFNLEIYQYDQKSHRKVRRFLKQELRKRYQQIYKNEVNFHQNQKQNKIINVPENSLDILD